MASFKKMFKILEIAYKRGLSNKFKKSLIIGFNGISGIFRHQLSPRTQFHLSGRRRSGFPAGHARLGRQDERADIQSVEIVGTVT
jgi:hypothetical protein